MAETGRRIAFIGTGSMGFEMARRLIAAGFDLSVYDREPERCERLVELGARLAEGPADAVRDADVAITMVGGPEDVEDLYLSRGGLVDASRQGAYLIDMTTVTPELARDVYGIAEVSERHAFDAPVVGGVQAAREGRLTVLCGADEATVAPVRDVLDALAGRVVCTGGAGRGQAAKLASQVAFSCEMLGLAEAVALARQGGLDPETALEALGATGAVSAAAAPYGALMAAADYTASDLAAGALLGDLGLALQAAEEEGLSLPGAETASQLYRMLDEMGGGRMGAQAVDLVYSDEETCAGFGLSWSDVSGLDGDAEVAGGVAGYAGSDDDGYDDAYGEDDDAYGDEDDDDARLASAYEFGGGEWA